MMAAPALSKIAHGHLRKDLDMTADELFALLDLALRRQAFARALSVRARG